MKKDKKEVSKNTKSKPINIDVNLHTAIKLYCGLKNISMKKFVNEVLTNAIDPDIMAIVIKNAKDEITVDSVDDKSLNQNDMSEIMTENNSSISNSDSSDIDSSIKDDTDSTAKDDVKDNEDSAKDNEDEEIDEDDVDFLDEN
ncbi:hypothetical protein [Clostridium baratii]|uniref:hypothetical protein n=1 Tax=Clostridium baratii TaxID=1561 RepID=UPI0005F2E735|nr:hypothetical protein [Clostridium baratii]AQM58558.1 hypothetical protein NPD11_3072 [Clostridium baratii]KJU70937.1 hypothetical protein UC77_12255 [Clostridium baratii]